MVEPEAESKELRIVIDGKVKQALETALAYFYGQDSKARAFEAVKTALDLIKDVEDGNDA